MTTPKWQGSDRALGRYRIRILWFRVLLSGALGFGLGASYTAWPAAKTAPDKPALGEAVTEPAPLPKLENRQDPRSEAVAELLASRRIDLNFDQTPFNDTLAFLRSITGLNLIVDAEARDIIENEGLEVSLKLRSISVKNALLLILSSSSDLRYEIRKGIIAITADDASAERFLEYYDVRDLLDGRLLGRGGASVSPEKLLELIEQALGDNSDDGRFEITSSIVIARCSLSAHRTIKRLIEQLREGADRILPEPAWAAPMKATLTRPMSFNGVETPFADFVAFFQDVTGLNVVVDREVDSEEIAVSLKLKNVPCGELLTLVLEQAELTSTLRDEALVIHSKEQRSFSRYDLRVLDLRDLVLAVDDDEDCGCLVVAGETDSIEFDCEEELEEGLDPEQVVELIREETGEDLWEDPARIEVHRGQLLVVHTAEVHRAIDAILAKMRRVSWRGKRGS